MATTFRRNAAGMSSITRTMGAQAALQAAQRGAAWARANAPVRTGNYRSQIVAEPATVEVGGKTRQGARVVAKADYSAGVEWGRGASHLLGRTVDYIEKGH